MSNNNLLQSSRLEKHHVRSAKKNLNLVLKLFVVLFFIAASAAVYFYCMYSRLSRVELVFISNKVQVGSCTVSKGTEVAMADGAVINGYNFVGWKDENGNIVADEVIRAEKNAVFSAVYSIYSEDNAHNAYLFANKNGFFYPADGLTRADAVQMFYSLAGYPNISNELNYSDIGKNDSLASAAAFSKEKNLIRGDKMYPERSVTWNELFQMIEVSYPLLDLDMVKIERIDEPITRYETAKIMNQLLGREPDQETIDSLFAVIPDANAKNEYYSEFVEAAIDHVFENDSNSEEWISTASYQKLEAGFNEINGELYYVQPDGTVAISSWLGSLFFDENGHYTSGNYELDQLVKKILAEIITDDMTDLEKLKAAYDYVVKNVSYRKGNLYEIGETGWAAEEAYPTLSTGHGNCYGFAGAFCVLARALHFEAVEYSGVIPQDADIVGAQTEHGWVEVTYEGSVYICDPELGYVNYKDMFMMTLDSNYVARWQYIRDPEAVKKLPAW